MRNGGAGVAQAEGAGHAATAGHTLSSAMTPPEPPVHRSFSGLSAPKRTASSSVVTPIQV